MRTDYTLRERDMAAADQLDPTVLRLLDSAPVKILAESVLMVQQLYGVAAARNAVLNTIEGIVPGFRPVRSPAYMRRRPRGR